MGRTVKEIQGDLDSKQAEFDSWYSPSLSNSIVAVSERIRLWKEISCLCAELINTEPLIGGE